MVRKPIWIAAILLGLSGIACLGSAQVASGPQADQVSGEQVFERLGCGQCHNGAGAVAAPSLHGLYAQEVELEGGETVVADEAYLRESILSPQSKIVRGYQPIMPQFKELITAEQLDALVEYIRSLSP